VRLRLPSRQIAAGVTSVHPSKTPASQFVHLRRITDLAGRRSLLSELCYFYSEPFVALLDLVSGSVISHLERTAGKELASQLKRLANRFKMETGMKPEYYDISLGSALSELCLMALLTSSEQVRRIVIDPDASCQTPDVRAICRNGTDVFFEVAHIPRRHLTKGTKTEAYRPDGEVRRMMYNKIGGKVKSGQLKRGRANVLWVAVDALSYAFGEEHMARRVFESLDPTRLGGDLTLLTAVVVYSQETDVTSPTGPNDFHVNTACDSKVQSAAEALLVSMRGFGDAASDY